MGKLGLGFVGAILVGVLGCGEDHAHDDEEDSVHVAVVLPLSGPEALKGQRHDAAMRLALEHLSDSGYLDLLGRPFRIEYVDAGSGIAGVESELAEVIEHHTRDDGTPRIFAILTSSRIAQHGASELAASHQIPLLEVSSGEPFGSWVSGDRDYLLSAGPLCTPTGEVTADFMNRDYDGQTAVVVRGDDTHDKLHADRLRARLETLSSTVTIANSTSGGDFVLDEHDEASFQTQLEQIIAQHDPEVLYFHIHGSASTTFLKAARDAGYTGDIISCGSSRSESLLGSEPSLDAYLEGRMFYANRGPVPSQALDDFERLFTASHPTLTVDPWTAHAYDAMLLAGLAISVADGSTGPALLDAIVETSRGGEVVNFESLERAIELVQDGSDLDLDGASGSLDIDDARTPMKGSYYIERVVSDGNGGVSYEELTDFPRQTHPTP